MAHRALIIQARYSSSRLPGKTILPLADKKVVAHIAERALAISGLDAVCLAVADEQKSELLVDFLEAHYPDIMTITGDVDDVLARYHKSADELQADTIMRITSDCPLFDPRLCTDMLELFNEHDYDYVSNNLIASFPHGLDCEIFSREILDEAMKHANTSEQREHVTPWIRDNPHLSLACLYDYGSDDFAVSQRWTLDYKEDLLLLEALMAKNPPVNTDFRTNLAAMRRYPNMMRYNTQHQMARKKFMPCDDQHATRNITYHAWRDYGDMVQRDPFDM